MELAELEHRVASAADPVGYVRQQNGENWTAWFFDRAVSGPRPGTSSSDRYLPLGCSPQTTERTPQEELVERLTGKRPTRRGHIPTHVRPPVPTGERESVLSQTRSPKYRSKDAVVRAVLQRSQGRSEYSGETAGWFKRNGEPGLTVHHPWPHLDGTGVAIAITFSEHARIHYGADGESLNEALKERLREIEPGEQPDDVEEQAA